MNTQVEVLTDKENTVKLTVTIEADEINKRMKKAYKNFATHYKFPGFRKGKAPRPVVDSTLGPEVVRSSVTDDVVNETFPRAVEAELLYPQSNPQFDEIGIVQEGVDFSYSATIALKPVYELTSYDPVEIELPSEKATDEEVQAELNNIAEHYFTYEDREEGAQVEEGSIVEIKLSAVDDNGDLLDHIATDSRVYTVGSGFLSEAFDAELTGLKKGDTKSFAIDNPGEASPLTTHIADATKKIACEVEIKAVKKKVVPEVTDEWVKEHLGFDTIEAVRERIVASLEQQKASLVLRAKENRCLDVLATRLEGEVAEELCTSYERDLTQNFFRGLQRSGVSFDAYLKEQDLTSEQFKEDVKKQAVDEAKRACALDAWARHSGFEVGEDDITAEFVGAGVADPDAAKNEWLNSGRMPLVREGILRRKALEDVVGTAVVTEEDSSSQSSDNESAQESE